MKSTSLAEKIVSFLDIGDARRILEIGPGGGALTGYLLRLGRNLTVVEKDSRFAHLIKKKFAGCGADLTVINDDFLNIKPADITGRDEKLAVIGNLPYNRSVDILFHLFSMREFITRMVLMFQREVAERIVAEQGSREYGAISVLSRLYSDIKILLNLSPEDFKPRPEVHSTVLEFTITGHKIPEGIDESDFSWFVHNSFMYKRKTLINSLRISTGLKREKLLDMLSDAGINPAARAEELSLEVFLRLYRSL